MRNRPPTGQQSGINEQPPCGYVRITRYIPHFVFRKRAKAVVRAPVKNIAPSRAVTDDVRQVESDLADRSGAEVNFLGGSMKISTSRGTLLAAVVAAVSLGAAACGGGAGGGGNSAHTVTVAVVANPDMQQMEQLIGTFEKQNPGITVKFDTLPEDQERAEIQKDIATNGGLYDVVMI